VLVKEGLVIKATDIGMVLVMSQVHMSDTAERGISPAYNPEEHFSYPGIMFPLPEQGHVSSLVNQVSADNQAMSG
jgi:hypothetical protein